jgi:taurine dioxygenase
MSVATKLADAAQGTIVAGRPMPDFRRIGVAPLTGACGAEITGVDLAKPLDPETLAEVMLAFQHFLVIIFRDQHLTPEQHKAF